MNMYIIPKPEKTELVVGVRPTCCPNVAGEGLKFWISLRKFRRNENAEDEREIFHEKILRQNLVALPLSDGSNFYWVANNLFSMLKHYNYF